MSWLPDGALPARTADIYGPWLTASGHGLLPPGGGTLAGPASFAASPGPAIGASVQWPGWLVIDTAAGAQRVAVTSGGSLRLLPATVPAGAVQLISPSTGVTWSLYYPAASAAELSLAWTTDNGRSWQRSDLRRVFPAGSAAVPCSASATLITAGSSWATRPGVPPTAAEAGPVPSGARSGATVKSPATRTGCPGLGAGWRTDLIYVSGGSGQR